MDKPISTRVLTRVSCDEAGLMMKTLVVMFTLAAGLALAAPATSQGSGVIVEGNVRGALQTPPLNPLTCNHSACQRLVELLFPSFIGADRATGYFAGSTGDDYVLARSWEVSEDGLVYTFHLRDDLFWSDGTPVTAYDVFYTYLALDGGEIHPDDYVERVEGQVAAVVPLDAATVAFVLDKPYCSVLHTLQFHVAPAHVFEPDFTAVTVETMGDGSIEDRWRRWQRVFPRRSLTQMVNHPFNQQPTVTAGPFRFDSSQPTDYVRLASDGGALALDFVDVPDSTTQVNMFLRGELTILRNPPYERRADIRAARNVQVYEFPGRQWYYVGLNLADPRRPRHAFSEDGLPLDQGVHPILGDVRVRRALQMATDVDGLIAGAVHGNGMVMAGYELPDSWSFDPALAAVPYDMSEAAWLLEQAGWHDSNGDGIRECRGCQTAREGAEMYISLLYPASPSGRALGRTLAAQWRGLGVLVDAFDAPLDSLFSSVIYQDFDAFVGIWSDGFPVTTDMTPLFTAAGDVVGEGWNFTSYSNPEVEALLAEARALPGCSVEARAALHRQAQAIIQADQPYIWLFAVRDMVALQGGVRNVDLNAPLWNIEEWVILP